MSKALTKEEVVALKLMGKDPICMYCEHFNGKADVLSQGELALGFGWCAVYGCTGVCEHPGCVLFSVRLAAKNYETVEGKYT